MKKPISLKNLPSYLKYLRENNKIDEHLVVDMGTITRTNFSYAKIFMRFSVVILICFIISAGFLKYKNAGDSIIIVDIVEETEDIRNLAMECGEIISIKNEGKTYEIKIDKSKDKNLILEILKKNKNIKNIR